MTSKIVVTSLKTSIILGVILVLAGCASAPQGYSAVTLPEALTSLATSVENGLTQKDQALTVSTFQDVNTANASKTKVFGTYISDELLGTLKSNFPDLQVLDRGDVDQILSERTYSSEGVQTDQKMKNLGSLTPARYIVTGEFTVFSKTVEIQTKLLDIRDGSILTTKDEVVEIDQDVRSLLTGVLPQAPLEVVQAPQSPTNVSVSYFQLGVRQENSQHPSEALVAYTRAVKVNPRLYLAYVRRGELLLRLHRWKEAQSDFQIAVAHLPRQTAPLLGLAHAWAGEHAWGQANNTFRQAIERFPHDWWVWQNYGLFLFNSRHYAEALDCLNHAVQFNPRAGDAWVLRARTLKALGRDDEARENYQRAVEQAKQAHNQRRLAELEKERLSIFF